MYGAYIRQEMCIRDSNDEAKLRTLQDGGVPIHEDYLPEVLDRHRGHSIEFTSDLRAATQAAQAIFIAVGTPQSRTGSADLSYVCLLYTSRCV